MAGAALEKAGHPGQRTFAPSSGRAGRLELRALVRTRDVQSRCILLVGLEIMPFPEVEEENNL